MSTIHDAEHPEGSGEDELSIKRRGTKSKPEAVNIPCPPCVQPYNAHMGGVDFLDHMVKFYNCGRRSKKWYRRVLFHLVELCIHNAFIVESSFLTVEERKTRKRQSFREELVDLLIGTYSIRRRSSAGRPSIAYQNETRFQNVGVHLPEYHDTRRDCQQCQLVS